MEANQTDQHQERLRGVGGATGGGGEARNIIIPVSIFIRNQGRQKTNNAGIKLCIVQRHDVSPYSLQNFEKRALHWSVRLQSAFI